MATKTPSGPRAAAIVGPYLCGKTALFESILMQTGAVGRKGTSKDGYAVGDATPEAKKRQMSTEVNIASSEYIGEAWTFLDCPGSIELIQDTLNALMVADTAIVVCEPDAARVLTVAPILKFLDENDIPHILFINKMDTAISSVKEILEALQQHSKRPMLLREIPIREGEKIIGHVDLVSERAFQWTPGQPSELIEIPGAVQGREEEARAELLESLADFDDTLLEELLEDIVPTSEEIYSSLTKDLQNSYIVPVFFGSAEQDNGIRRLLKALRHESPGADTTAERLGVDQAGGGVLAQVFKTVHAGHAGKLSFARVLRGEVSDGMTLNGERVSGLHRVIGQKHEKMSKAGQGDIAAFGRMDGVTTGDVLTDSGNGKGADADWPDARKPLFALSIHAEHREDEVKLSGALAKLADEDTSLSYGHDQDTGEFLLWGQGEVHLLVTIDRLKEKYGLAVTAERPQVPYKETIRQPVSQHARHKKQSGGHGEFGDVHLDIKPLPRGSGFQFDDVITGGVVPKQYIPAVRTGVQEFMVRGPLGFPVVDVAVTLTDGQFHAVDSSEMAFKKAAAQAMREGMPNCKPVLLEPIFQVHITLPNDFTSKVQRLVSGRRGQILGFDAKPGWAGWDEVTVQLPQSEMHDLIIELRSMTLGVGFFDWEFDHLQELSGKDADTVVAQRSKFLARN
ncbi:MAG: elongation factor G [Rhodospirillales bacterium]|nr:elongation factor G [Alphaproteobacteria bacterium]MBL6947193.1 elongation factor G [Rhodospirillales bacterium]